MSKNQNFFDTKKFALSQYVVENDHFIDWRNAKILIKEGVAVTLM